MPKTQATLALQEADFLHMEMDVADREYRGGDARRDDLVEQRYARDRAHFSRCCPALLDELDRWMGDWRAVDRRTDRFVLGAFRELRRLAKTLASRLAALFGAEKEAASTAIEAA